jgi:hypothetical protein
VDYYVFHLVSSTCTEKGQKGVENQNGIHWNNNNFKSLTQSHLAFYSNHLNCFLHPFLSILGLKKRFKWFEKKWMFFYFIFIENIIQIQLFYSFAMKLGPFFYHPYWTQFMSSKFKPIVIIIIIIYSSYYHEAFFSLLFFSLHFSIASPKKWIKRKQKQDIKSSWTL